VSKEEFGVVRPVLLFGGANSYDAGPVSLPFRDGVEDGGGPLDKASNRKKMITRKFYFEIYLRVPVLLMDLSESFCSVFCGFNEDDESKSADVGSASSSNFRLFVLLFECRVEYISEN
jgi:hypothetical protein